MGLKPFDLIWVEGKSFAWLYPSEIDELKEIAPAVDVPVAAKVNTVAEAPASPAPLETISTAHVYAIKPRENESRVQTISIPSGEPPTRDPAPRIIVEEEHLPVGESNNNEIKAEDKAADVPKEPRRWSRYLPLARSSRVSSSRIMSSSAALFIPTATMVRPFAFFSWHSGDMQ